MNGDDTAPPPGRVDIAEESAQPGGEQRAATVVERLNPADTPRSLGLVMVVAHCLGPAIPQERRFRHRADGA